MDMTPEMLAKSQETARLMGLDQVEFRQGLAEDLPIEDGWADVAISNGVLNLVADKARAFSARSSGCCGRTGDSSSPTSPSAERSRRRRSVTSTCRPTASRAACPVTAGGTHFETPGSSTSRSDHPWTPSAAPRARPTPEPSRSSVTPSSPQARPVTPRCRCVAGCQTAGAAEGGERATCACSPGEHPVAREDQRARPRVPSARSGGAQPPASCSRQSRRRPQPAGSDAPGPAQSVAAPQVAGQARPTHLSLVFELQPKTSTRDLRHAHPAILGRHS